MAADTTKRHGDHVLVRGWFRRVAMAWLMVMLLAVVAQRGEVPTARALSYGSVITNVNTDKSRYNPGDSVTIWVDLTNATGATITNGTVTLYFKHFAAEIAPSSAKSFSLDPGSSTTLSWTWTPPAPDFQGYAVEAWARDGGGNILDNYNTAVDVSSDWTKFPRYGYMSTWPNQSSGESARQIWNLKNYHINALQFYDWQFKHHIPLAGTVANPAASWNDIANRPTYRQTVLDQLNTARGYNITNFAYNAANAAFAGYGEDGSGVSYQWGLWNNASCGDQESWTLPGNWATSALYLFDPANTNWQNYIAGRMNDVFAAYPFDGWHVDQLVVRNPTYTCGGQSQDIFGKFPGFLNAMKAKTGKRLIFNSSGDTALSGVSQTGVDVLYTEWFSGKTYNDIKLDLDYARSLNAAKPLVFALYMDRGRVGQYFGAPGVLLTDAAIFANGGDHIELGDGFTSGTGVNMLDSEYYPNKDLSLTSDLQRRLRNYYDFRVAYQNLLRDGQTNTSNSVQIGGVATSTNATPNAVWTITKTGGGYDTINMVNLLGESTNDAFDYNSDRPAPTAKTNLNVKYYYGSGSVSEVNFASPDTDNGKTTTLGFTTGADGGGNYVSFTLPSLQYWDLVYVKKTQANSAPIGKTIWLKANANGRYVSAWNDANRTLQARVDAVGTWERFQVVDAGSGFVALKALVTNQYASAWNDANRTLQARVTWIGDWEKFTWVDAGGGFVALKANVNGQYVSAWNDPDRTLQARSGSIGEWEKFTWAETP